MREKQEHEWTVVNDYDTDTIHMYFTKKHLWTKTIQRLQNLSEADAPIEYVAEEKHGGFFLRFPSFYAREPWQFVKASTKKLNNLS